MPDDSIEPAVPPSNSSPRPSPVDDDGVTELAGLPTTRADGDPMPEKTVVMGESVTPSPRTERPAPFIGRYKLLKKLGKGGFGIVWQAEQTEPIHREVALKIIKPGMDSAEIIARFAAERQALAMMDHPNIASVLDAGATERGQPYFVMELVKGVPITEYCDAHRLTIRQRLELFIPVCQAVQHAHQKAILHRDLKSSNILVEEVDGQPVPKVIDFGIAKAFGATPEEVFQASLARTREGLVIGTPQYMSPEQAGSVPDVDTRSDVYSLGAVLYELLTGQTPLSGERLKQAAFDEILRLVREDEAKRPSSRFTPVAELVQNAASQRSGAPWRSMRHLRLRSCEPWNWEARTHCARNCTLAPFITPEAT